jgi:exodeoxyribonuclease-3
MWSALTWNILFGGEERFDAILALLARVKPDVAVLQECLSWDEGDRLSRVAGALGVPYIERHVTLGLARARPSGRRFHVALLSRFPIERTTTHADPELVGHVILEARVATPTPTGPVTVLGTHFDSHGEDQRLRDARTLSTLLRTSEPLLVAGDLNALSTRDPYPHNFTDLLKSAGTEKYGMPPRFEVMPLLESAGLVDLRPDPWVTAMRDRGGVRIDYRTDYLLASPPLAAHCRSVEVIACQGASDHEPVLARFA